MPITRSAEIGGLTAFAGLDALPPSTAPLFAAGARASLFGSREWYRTVVDHGMPDGTRPCFALWPDVAAPRAFVDFVEELQRRGRHPIVVALGNPYLLQQIPDVSAYLIAWGGFPVSQRAAARALLGAAPITGQLPISIPPAVQIGVGAKRPALPSSARAGSR